MYIPPYHAETDLDTVQSLIDAQPLGAWVTLSPDGLIANHIPFILDRSRGEFGVLRAHVSRANTVWQRFSTEQDSLVMFQGPQSYITPSWYPTRLSEGKVVPTWNYAVVHAHGRPRAIEDPRWILQLLKDLTEHSEAGQAMPWKVADAPQEFIERLARAVVGIEIPITKLQGKWKLSQDEAMPDRLGTVAGLAALGDANSLALARLVEEQIK
ncbi:FMN-binding negative transcriptional regulator [Roseateles oligotrophus]|uniref:FMN-binding negative transcriptional regulator n=1 Tax=Roseateles oligotrophus TaxID=1769250 RepID=A0ABT2YG86_9BURK|nr:FMN-binding negative transcriptional regulator [Roseateles oligotrophus]MCV2369067.1 FMN-binding negative transcriptional regulator [Roseateles oligotrophus]